MSDAQDRAQTVMDMLIHARRPPYQYGDLVVLEGATVSLAIQVANQPTYVLARKHGDDWSVNTTLDTAAPEEIAGVKAALRASHFRGTNIVRDGFERWTQR